MNVKRLALRLKLILAGMALCGLAIYGWALPSLGQAIVWANPEFAGWYWPWLGFAWVTALPCYGALFAGWNIAANIGADRSFTLENAQWLRRIAYLAAGDAALVLLGNVLYLLLNLNHPGVFLLFLMVVFGGAAIAVASSALAELVRRAAELQDQSDWTI